MGKGRFCYWESLRRTEETYENRHRDLRTDHTTNFFLRLSLNTDVLFRSRMVGSISYTPLRLSLILCRFSGTRDRITKER